jgi:hypothetical protein
MSKIVKRYFSYDKHRFFNLLESSERFKYAYIETPKVACSTIKYYLQLLEYDGDRSKIYYNVHIRSESPIRRVHELKYSEAQITQLLLGAEYFHFTFVRNPYTRVLSCYLEKIVQRMFTNDFVQQDMKKKGTDERFANLGIDVSVDVSFVEFLRAVKNQSINEMDIHWMPQADILGVLNGYRYDFIGRFEHFDADFVRVLDRLGAPADWYQTIENRQRTVTKAKEKLLEYYTPEAIELVQEIYAEDFVRFGYGYSLDLA